jgi:hypothetical protein
VSTSASESSFSLVPQDERGTDYRLDNVVVQDGDVIEILTDTGWVSGHFRSKIHPETGDFAFEMHVVRNEPPPTSTHDHATVYIPFYAKVRWSEKE